MTNSTRLLSLGALAALVTLLAAPTPAAAVGPKPGSWNKPHKKPKAYPKVPKSAVQPSTTTPAPAGNPRTQLMRPDTPGNYTQFGKLVGLSVKADGELRSIKLAMGGNQQRYSGCGATLADLGHLAPALPHRPEVIVKMRNRCVYSVEVGF